MRNKKGFVRRTTVAPIAIAEVPLGVVAGAALGAFAGPPGIVAGAAIGSIVGAVLAIGHNRQMHIEALEEERVDRELGVIWGDIGAPNLSHPPPRAGGLYSAGSTGLGTSDGMVAAGPINAPVK